MHILLIEDDKRIAAFISKGLQEEYFTVDHVCSGEEGISLAESVGYDLVILDLMLPGINGVEVCRKMRKKGIQTAIIMLTAKRDVKDRVLGLDAGADDYITKPFSFDELLARIRSVLRRKQNLTLELQYEDLRIDIIAHRVYFQDQEIILRPKEFAMLSYLLRNRGRVRTRTQILENVWGYNFDTNTNIVDVYIRFLREKLAPFLTRDVIRTVRGMGYMVED